MMLRMLPGAVLLISLLLLSSCRPQPSPVRFVDGLTQPRGLSFDAAGNLYVAEAGAVRGDENTTVSPIVNHSSRVLRVAPDGAVTTVVEGLPYTNYAVAGDIGAADTAFVGGAMAVLTGEGYDDELSRAVLWAVEDGIPDRVISIRRFVESIAPLNSLMGIDGSHAANPFAMAVAPDGASLYISDAASGRVMQMMSDGSLRVVAEFANSPPLTGLAFDAHGELHVAVLSELPFAAGNGSIWKVTAESAPQRVVPNLTMAVDVAFDRQGAMYVLEFSSGPAEQMLYAAESGRLLRIAQDGVPAVLLDGLNYPTSLAFSPAGDLYLAVNGAFSAAGEGAVLVLPCSEIGC